MFESLFESWIRQAITDVLEDGAEISSGADGALQTGLSLPIADEPESVDFWLTFTKNAPNYTAEGDAIDPDAPEYLVISLWIPGEDVLPPQATDHAGTFALLNAYNQEPGIKCRVDSDTFPGPRDAPVLVEVDLAFGSIAGPEPIANAIERLADFAINSLPAIRTYLAAEYAAGLTG